MRTLLCIFWTAVLIPSALSQEDQLPPVTSVELAFANAQLTLPSDVTLFSRDSAVMFLRTRFHPNYDVDGLLLSTSDGVTWHARLKFYNVGYITMEQLQDEIPSLDLLAELRKNVNEENKQRELEGYQTVAVTRIIEPPQLDPQRQLLEFAVETLQDTLFSIERHMFFFGGRGFLHAVVTAPQGLYPTVKPLSTEVFSTLVFNPGSRYDDRDPNVAEAEGGFGKAFFRLESAGGGWVMPLVVSLIILASVGLLYYDRLFPKKKQKVVPGRKGRPLATKTPARRF
ncbi:MAG TPA: DUF2167 domain-containing protein [Bacteroidota bacterium]|nr:DUF2167 domain-containing protein [Bacteroidota bacterium]